jgi:hypothetical protein
MAQPVDRMSMAACILRDPLFAAASAKHGRIITQRSYCGVSRKTRVGPAWTWLSALTS